MLSEDCYFLVWREEKYSYVISTGTGEIIGEYCLRPEIIKNTKTTAATV